MELIEDLRKRASGTKTRIVLPDGNDDRVHLAAETMLSLNFGDLVILGDEEKLADLGKTFRKSARKIQYLDPGKSRRSEAFARRLIELRKQRGKDLSLDEASEMARQPLYYSALLLEAGEADCSIAGSISATASVLKAGITVLGTKKGVSTVSSFFIVVRPDTRLEDVWFYADCAVIPNPSDAQLSDIASSTATNMRDLFSIEPRVAMLSFSTKGSAEHRDIDKVRSATDLLKKSFPDLAIDGEIQFDAAILPDVAKRKAPGSIVAGRANVFIFPDLDAGNIGYKITERLGHAKMIGPIVQGLAKPYFDLSRGCSADDIVNTAAIGCILAGKERVS